MSDDLTELAKELEPLFAATQVGQIEAFDAWMRAANLLIPVFNELRAYRGSA